MDREYATNIWQRIVKWGSKPLLTAYLRNGLSWQSGLCLEKIGENQIWLRAINSRGDITTGRISFPIDRIDELIEVLTAFKEE